jgi:NADPH:quinone reductase-like Zn-dependent oxidoreductase
VQIAKAFGADVTGVCSSTNVDLVKSLGADQVIDYVHGDFTRMRGHNDLIFDNAGNHPSPSLRRRLNPDRRLVYNSGASMRRMAVAVLLSRLGRNVSTFLATINHADLLILRGLIESGKLRSVVDRVYPLGDNGAAIAYVEAGHARGKVVVTVD